MAAVWSSCSRWPFLGLLMICAVARSSENNGPDSAAQHQGCSDVRTAYVKKGFNANEVPPKALPGNHLRICPQGFTCCTQSMEHKLSTQSRQEFDKIIGEKISFLRNTFISRTAKFDVFFTELLDNSKRDLHDMFVRTYGLLYQQNSHVFTDLFHDLRSYYKGKDMNLLDALDNFFTILLQKMFKLINTQYTFDKSYLQCVTEHMDDLKPFGDVPQKLSIQVKRAFIAARTFVQGLAIGRDVILEISKLQPTSACGKALMKMMYCPYCRGVPKVPACNNYCMNIMKGCLAYHAELNHEWNAYINALMKLAERLEGPFNIESVVDPIDVKISDAIMNFQENSESVSSKVFAGCGQPRLGRKKREAAEGHKGASQYSQGWTKFNRKQEYVRPTTAAGTNLDRLVRDIKEKVSLAKGFWSSLPHSICNDLAAPPSNENSCWNGLSKSRYQPEIMKDGIVNQINNPEVDVDVRKPNSLVNQQVLQLRIITSRLKNAYSGLDVDWIDTADVFTSGSGSGSGDGGSGGSYHPTDDLSFSQSTDRPPVIQTRRTPQSRSKYDYGNGATTNQVTFTHFLLLILTTVVYRL